MDSGGPSPYISNRSKHMRRKSLPGAPPPLAQPAVPNKVHVRPASPEVISSLISSLSIISGPAQQLFESPNGSYSSPASPSFKSGFNHADTHSGGRKGSFGIDYGAFKNPALEGLQEEQSLDDLAASPPVVRTSKPPSGYSPLTARKRSPSPLTRFLKSSSRPSSPENLGDRDIPTAIGEVTIESGRALPKKERLRQSSTDGRGRKNGRKMLSRMSSGEDASDSDMSRKRSSAQKYNTRDLLSVPKTDGSENLMAGTLFDDSSVPSYFTYSSKASPSTNSPDGSSRLSSGGFAGPPSPRDIPTRDSSLRNSSRTKRSSKRSSMRREENGEIAGTIREEGTSGIISTSSVDSPNDDRKSRLDDMTKNFRRQLTEPENISTLASKQVADSAKVEETLLEEAAPYPAVAQRRSRSRSPNDLFNRSTGKSKKGGKHDLDLSVLATSPKRSGSRLKRLSAPMSPSSPTSNDTGRHQRKLSLPGLERENATSPEPARLPQVVIDDKESIDSIDESVESYLTSPRLSQTIRHPQTGRKISFSEVGDSDGHAVFCCVGMGLTRYITAFYDELALTLKLRLITPDRPGVGDSEPYTDGTSTPLSWPDDVYAICQTLKITKFSILAHSAGAIYALATALRMPQHIRGRIHLLAPWIPPSQMNVVGTQQVHPPSTSLPASQRLLRALPTPILRVANSRFMNATSSSITRSVPKSPRRPKRKIASGRDTPAGAGRTSTTPALDEPFQSGTGDAESGDQPTAEEDLEAKILAAAANTLADKERQMTYDTRLTHAIWDLATSGANPAVDLLVCLERRHTIGFRYVDITRPVVIHHGTRDTRVPVENVKWLGQTMKRCEVRILEGEGHGLMASAGVMGGVLMEISKEWEDWVKVTTKAQGGGSERPRTLKERASSGNFK